MSKSLRLSVTEQQTDGEIRRVTTIRDDAGSVEVEIFHQAATIQPLAPDTCLDGHVFALFIYLLSRGLPVHVEGSLSKQGMRNIHEMQLVWTRWKPGKYNKFDITSDSLIEPRRPEPGKVIAAYSGGADATFTAVMNRIGLPEKYRYPLTDVIMVHGFDVDLAKPQFFEDLQDRVRPLIDELGLKLRTIKTNSKDWKRQDWDDSFALELAACLHIAAPDCEVGLVGSSEPYEALVIPWGSTPIADHLISGDAMRIVHDGAGYSRTDKIAEIAKHPIAASVIKVCWAGEDQAENCGKCEKCIRTMLNFKASGNAVPPSFPAGLNVADIARIKIYTVTQMAELEGILRYAEKHGHADPEWVVPLKARMKAGYSSYGPTGMRKLAGEVLDAIGMKETVKKAISKSR